MKGDEMDERNTESEDGFEPAITLLNRSGDITISWDDEDQDKVEELVRKKMAQGYSFFIVREAGMRGAAPRLKEKDALRHRAPNNRLHVSNTVGSEQLEDADLMIALQDRVIRFSRSQKTGVPKKAVRRAETPQEVLSSQSVAIRPIAGG